MRPLFCRFSAAALVLFLALSHSHSGVAAQTNAVGGPRPGAGATPPSAAKGGGATFDRATLLAQANLPQPVPLPVPAAGTALPDTGKDTNTPLSIRFSQPLPGVVSVRRVSGEDGRLHLELYSAQGPLSGSATLQYGEQPLGPAQLQGSLWLTLKPRIGRLPIEVSAPGVPEPVQLLVPTTLVEVRGRQLYVNGEPFLLKGATGAPADQAEADFIHGLGLNTLRGLGAVAPAAQYGFMNIASLNSGEVSAKTLVREPDAEFEQDLGKSLERLKQKSLEPIASPFTLILQLGNEQTGGNTVPPGVESLSRVRRHVSQFLVGARNTVKPLAPMLPVGYANQDLGFLAPDCLDVYMHNSYLAQDRYDYPWEDFMRWQGCLPPEGRQGQGRPFVNSEFGANRYLCQAYHAGPNNPFLEKLHAWNLPCRWAEFMKQGTVGGAIYCLHDLESPRDQGCSCFGLLTHDRKPKLACWDVGHLWRDFEVQQRENELVVSFKRDYWARDCRLTLTVPGGRSISRALEDFAPHSTRSVTLRELGLATNGFRWALEFTTHSGLVNRAAGAWPVQLEESDFLESLKGRDTYPFLRELFDTEVLTVEGKPAPLTLAEMTRADGLIPVALRKRNGVTYLLLITREKPERDGALRGGVTLEVAFPGKVVKVDDMTGQPLKEVVEAAPIPGGVRLKNIQAARIPGAIGERSNTPFMLPVYRISPL